VPLVVEQRDGLGSGELNMDIRVRVPARRERLDVANIIDALLDSISPALGVNDWRMRHWSLDAHQDESEPECLVRIWEIGG